MVFLELKVLGQTASGNLLLSGGNKPLRNVPIIFNGRNAGRIIETIGRVDSPLYIATSDAGASLAGRKVEVKE